jgi:hypothetical protein
MTAHFRRAAAAMRHAVAVMALFLAGYTTPAAAFPTPFSGTGAIQVLGNNGLPPPDFRLILGVANTAYTVGADAGWTFSINNWLYNPATGQGGGDFVFASALGTIFGTGQQQALSFELDDPASPFFGVPLTLAHSYVATGGTGQYQGFQAIASSFVSRTIRTPFFEERGQFVSIPATTALAALALLALLTSRSRRR